MSLNIAEAISHPDKTMGPRDPVAQRILAVLEACAAQTQPVTITRIVEATGLAKSTIHRMCWKLEGLGFLEYVDGGFTVGTKLYVLATTNPVVQDIRAAAIPYLVDLHRTTNSAVALTIFAGGKALVVDALYTTAFHHSPRIGFGLPLHCTANGKAILTRVDSRRREALLGRAALPAATKRSIVHPVMIRRNLDYSAKQGYAISDEEFESGVLAVAAAFKVGEDAYGSVGCIGAPTSRQLRHAAGLVTSAAGRLERELETRALARTASYL